MLLGKPYVWGSIYRFDGQASVFWADRARAEAPCYRCLYPEPPPPGMVPSCAEGGVLGVLCASIGSIQVNEAIKLLTGIGEPLVGRLMVYDALEMDYRKIKVRKDPECPLCGKNPTITGLIDYEAFCGTVSEEAQEAAAGSTILATELKAKMDAGEDFLLVDVREPAEYEIVQVPGAGAHPQGRHPQRFGARAAAAGQADRPVLQERGAVGGEPGGAQGGRPGQQRPRPGRRPRVAGAGRPQPPDVLTLRKRNPPVGPETGAGQHVSEQVTRVQQRATPT